MIGFAIADEPSAHQARILGTMGLSCFAQLVQDTIAANRIAALARGV